MQSLTPEVARADELSRRAFTAELHKVATAIAAGPKAPGAPSTAEKAYAALATLIGAVTLARAVSDPAIASKIASTVEQMLLPTRSGNDLRETESRRRPRVKAQSPI